MKEVIAWAPMDTNTGEIQSQPIEITRKGCRDSIDNVWLGDGFSRKEKDRFKPVKVKIVRL